MFKKCNYLVTALTNINEVNDDIRIINFGNACCYSEVITPSPFEDTEDQDIQTNNFVICGTLVLWEQNQKYKCLKRKCSGGRR